MDINSMETKSNSLISCQQLCWKLLLLTSFGFGIYFTMLLSLTNDINLLNQSILFDDFLYGYASNIKCYAMR